MKIINLLLILSLISCTDKFSEIDTSKKIQLLVKENDSLKNILKSKYLFDYIKFNIIPSEETPEYNENEFKGKFVVLGYNKSDFLLVNGKFDYENRKFINSDTIYNNYKGDYEFSMKKEKNDKLMFYIDIDKRYGSKTHDTIIRMPYKSLWKMK